jgi:hypothetical protein
MSLDYTRGGDEEDTQLGLSDNDIANRVICGMGNSIRGAVAVLWIALKKPSSCARNSRERHVKRYQDSRQAPLISACRCASRQSP